MQMTETITKVAAAVAVGDLSTKVLNLLVADGQFIPHECDFWDYKERFPDLGDSIAVGKTLIDIVSLHNSFGGYLLFGVAESADRLRCVASNGPLPTHRDMDALRAKIEGYSGGPKIEISMARLQYKLGPSDAELALLHVAPRRHDQQPFVMMKCGPEEGKKPIFNPGVIYLRWGGKCIPQQSAEHMRFVLSARRSSSPLADVAIPSIKIHDNTLPDKQRICPNFVGRERLIERLWQWMPAEFDRMRVLAGEGGRGKTSIAFEFATEVCRVGPPGVARVLWFSGKQKQFIASLDAYTTFAQVDFCDAASLMRAIGSAYALTDEETAVTEGRDVLMRRVIEAVRHYPALIIVDDVDSVGSVDEQRRVHETVMQLANSTGSRFLVTTRMNLTYSPDTCLTIGGLEGSDYQTFVSDLVKRMSVVQPSSKVLEKLRISTDGSPLYTESIFRLVRQGETLGHAIDAWKGKDGESVRAAALRREIEHLGSEARRILLVAAHLKETSLSELVKVTGLQRSSVSKFVGELQALFLLSAPALGATELRFRVNETTARFAIEAASSLVTDPNAILKGVKALRGDSPPKSGDPARQTVALGVSQAMVQLGAYDYSSAIDTAQATVKAAKSGDAYVLLGRCQLARAHADRTPPDTDDFRECRKAFRQAAELGCRKPELYDLWFVAEFDAEHFSGAVDVATSVIDAGPCSDGEWYARRAAARSALARHRTLHGNVAQAETDISEAIGDLSKAIRFSRTSTERLGLEEAKSSLIEEAERLRVDDRTFKQALPDDRHTRSRRGRLGPSNFEWKRPRQRS